MNIENGKWYVGQALDVSKRFRQHKAMLRGGKHRNKHLQHAYDLYGEKAFAFVVLEACSPDALNVKEQEWIMRKDSFRAGYNDTAGGGGVLGFKKSDEERQKMSEARRGHIVSEATKAKISESHKSSAASARHMDNLRRLKMSRPATVRERQHLVSLNEKRKKAVECIETGEIFASAHEAARAIDSYQSNISLCCRKKDRTHKGYHWRYINEKKSDGDAV